MNAPEPQVVEQIVLQFPALAAWLIVFLVGVIVAGGGLAVTMFIKRLVSIEGLLSSEIKTLRAMHHEIDNRVVWLEASLGKKYGRRWDDQEHNGGVNGG